MKKKHLREVEAFIDEFNKTLCMTDSKMVVCRLKDFLKDKVKQQRKAKKEQLKQAHERLNSMD